jgi:hypothetical protein
MNYDEIVSVLKGTEFEEFLHRRWEICGRRGHPMSAVRLLQVPG